jgi:hypothetical protein
MISDLTTGSSVVISAGTYILSSAVDFTQNDLTIILEQGAIVKQADSTQSIDSLVTVSGDRSRWIGGTFDANIANNGTYTGRGESLRVSGDYCTGKDINFVGSHGGSLSAGLYTSGIHGVFDNIYANNATNSCVRDHGDFNTFTNLRFLNYTNKGFLKDSGVGGAASTYTYVHIASAITSAATALEAVLFDHDGVQGESCEVHFGYLSAPNMTGPDFIKFAYMKSVSLRGFRGDHAVVDAHRTTIRFQQEIERVVIDDCIFPGSVNFDANVECDLVIKGNTIIGDAMETPAALQDVAGILTIEDGTTLKNCRSYAITTDVNYPDTIINLGRLKFHGAATFTPSVINHLPYVGTKRRLQAGLITIRSPLSITGTMKSLAIDGRWIGLSDAQDAACAQAGDRTFLVSAANFPPREVESVQNGDIFRKRTPAVGDSPAEYRCTTNGAACTTAWTISTAYSLNNWVFNGSNVYVCVTAGTSAGSGGPTGTGTGIIDNTVTWDFVDTLAILKGVSSIDAGTETLTAASPTLAVTGVSILDSTSNAVNGTLGSAVAIGLLKTISMTNASNSSTVSVTNHETSDPEVFTFAQVDDTLVLMWTGTEWITIANSGVAV